MRSAKCVLGTISKMARLRYSLIKTVYEWLLDQEHTPYFLINAEAPKVMVPREYVEEGEIVLDASPSAIDDMVFDEDGISFSAGFGGDEFRIYFPLDAVLALYAEETEQGLFATEDSSTLLIQEGEVPFDSPPEKMPEPEKPVKRGHLKLVK